MIKMRRSPLPHQVVVVIVAVESFQGQIHLHAHLQVVGGDTGCALAEHHHLLGLQCHRSNGDRLVGLRGWHERRRWLIVAGRVGPDTTPTAEQHLLQLNGPRPRVSTTEVSGEKVRVSSGHPTTDQTRLITIKREQPLHRSHGNSRLGHPH